MAKFMEQELGKQHEKDLTEERLVAQSVKRLPSAQVMIPGSWD